MIKVRSMRGGKALPLRLIVRRGQRLEEIEGGGWALRYVV